jgi:hypothetical protein
MPLGCRLLIAALAAGLLALPALSADDEEDDGPGFELIALSGAAVTHGPRQPGDLELLAGLPFTGVRAEAHPVRRVAFFWVGEGLQFYSGGVVLGFEGGASLLLLDGLHLRGSYRFEDYDVDLLPATPVDRTRWGPFVGFDYRF